MNGADATLVVTQAWSSAVDAVAQAVGGMVGLSANRGTHATPIDDIAPTLPTIIVPDDPFRQVNISEAPTVAACPNSNVRSMGARGHVAACCVLWWKIFHLLYQLSPRH